MRFAENLQPTASFGEDGVSQEYGSSFNLLLTLCVLFSIIRLAAKKLAASVDVMNGLDEVKFPLLLNRVVSKLHLRVSAFSSVVTVF